MDKKNKPKKIPYGISDYELMRKENHYYIDKTRFIRNIEDSSRYLFFIRPRRFGKSLWLSVLEAYYDIRRQEEFDDFFSGTYIHDNPTEERNSYFILKFNFSGVRADIDKVEGSFNFTIKMAAMEFVKKYNSYLEDNTEDLYETVKTLSEASEILKYIINLTKGKGKIYLLIDEYDNFTNTIISSEGEERYTAITHGEGFFRHFFNVIKAGTTGTGAPISKLFITGVSPVTMDDVTSGFNIGDNITITPGFNEMAGFTEKEVIEMLDYYTDKKLINEPSEKIINIMKPWYNNYLFSEDETERVYNSDMVLYFIKEYIKFKKLPKKMLDQNIKTDYKKLKYLVITDIKGKLRINGNFEKIKMILEEGQIASPINTAFPAHTIIEPENFISLLYFLGFLTIKGVEYGMPVLSIPNELIRQLYYEYIREGYRDTDIFNINFFKLSGLFKEMAYKGKWEDLIDYLASEMKEQTSLRDYIQGEKCIQTFLRVYLNVTNYYITKTEPELNKGYGDILLLPNLPVFPDMGYSYIFEIKYIKVKDFTEKELERKLREGKEVLLKYGEDEDLKRLTGSTELIKIVLVFSGVELKCREKVV